jgi:outer membrane protein OmpA-like peptidoglycan-associated protein
MLLASVAATIIPALASAQPVSGLYVGAGAGVNLLRPERDSSIVSYGTLPNLPVGGTLGQTFVGFLHPRSDAGAAAVSSVGYGLGNGLRVEIEGDYRYNSQNVNNDRIVGVTNREQKFGGLVNVLYDFNLGLSYLDPYLGAGAGYMHVDRPLNLPSSGGFAYQGIAGVSVPIAIVPGLSATVEYRFLGLDASKSSQFTPANFAIELSSFRETTKFSAEYNHSILLGVRYAFRAPSSPPPVVPTPVVAPAPAPSRTYLIFFDWDKSILTDRARQIIAEAASASTHVSYTRIEVNGYTDLSGTAQYNQGLSVRRADAVAAELVRLGVPRTAISTRGFGESNPLVPTAQGVREPQNRRVEIILR